MPHVNSPGNSRNQKRKTRKGGDDEDASDYHPEGVSAGPRKRQKRSTTVASNRNGSRRKRKNAAPEEFRRVRGRRGLLERLVDDVPLELTIEVFRYLEPLDILRLARTSRALRCILMSRSSEDIWRAARANVEGLPPLPLDLNEPQIVWGIAVERLSGHAE
ncbi:hypothetical protein VKT23_013214 [Stygiomarasmius scandens]|uniref:F-box domain-containing protein n=1 Tax=Marasmiellus scandens TaxID=2682957 RepID=A0ABR1J555_9AGAR